MTADRALGDATELDRSKRAWGRWALRVAAAGVAVAILAIFLPTDDLIAAARGVPLVVWFGAVVGFLAAHVLGASKWWILMRASSAGVRYPDAVRSHLVGLFGNLFLPSVIGGDALRVGTAVGQANKPESVVGATVVDRALDMAVLGLLAAASGALAPGSDRNGLLEGGLLLGLIAAGLVVAWFGLKIAAGRLPAGAPGAGFVRRLSAASSELVGQGRAITLAAAATIVVQSGLVVVAWRIGLACGIDVGLAVWTFGWTLGKVAAVLPITQGGIGVREAALAGVLTPFGVPAALAVAAGLVFECVIVVGGLIGGLTYLVTRPRAAG